MATSSARNPENPQFFKVVFADSVEDGKITIPKKFVRLYGNSLLSSVFLHVPFGGVWKVELSNHNDNLWLENGWRQFADHHSVEEGHLILFKYIGSSRFKVSICDRSATEIAYPPVHVGPTNYSGFGESEIETESDGVEILNEMPPRRKGKEKGTRTGEVTPCRKGKKKATKTGDCQIPPTLQRLQPKVVKKFLELLEDQNVAMQKALEFETDNPFFLLLMSETFIKEPKQKNIPLPFAQEYFPGDAGNVILQVAGGRSDTKWTLRYKIYDEIRKCQMKSGWRSFVLDNNLQMDDICMFELVESSDLTLKVTIYRETEIENHDRENGTAAEKERFVIKRKRKESRWSKSKAPARIRPTANAIPVDMASPETLQAANSFRSDCPFFKVVIQAGHVRGENLIVPNHFCRKHFPGALKTVQLRVEVFLWPVGLQHFAHRARQFSVGWTAFVTENHLQPGNICFFEKMTTRPTIFQVTIFR